MLDKLFKMAFDLDKRGFHNEAAEIERVMEAMAKRVGLKLEEIVSLANHFDGLGETELADTFDVMAKEAAKKEKVKKPPKPWMDAAVAKIKKKNPDYSKRRCQEIAGSEWFDKMSDKSRDKVWKELDRKGKAEKTASTHDTGDVKVQNEFYPLERILMEKFLGKVFKTKAELASIGKDALKDFITTLDEERMNAEEMEAFNTAEKIMNFKDRIWNLAYAQ